MKRISGLPKNVRENIRLQNELKSWDQRLHSLRLAIKYKEANIEEEMESKIAQWRGHAQNAAKGLLPYYQKQSKKISVYNDYDYEYTAYLTNDKDGVPSNEMEVNSQEEAQNKKKDGGSAASDDMSTMLKAIGVDPDLLHYSTELGDFTS